jgi:predicted RNA-binding protein YlxR (DUF448 family)
VREKKDLVRVVRTPGDRFELDVTGKLPGRGAYLCPSPACLGAAVKRRSFDRAFRQAVPKEAVAALEAGIQDYLRAGAGSAAGTSTESPTAAGSGQATGVDGG